MRDPIMEPPISHAHRGMTAERALRWLVDFGSGWVDAGKTLMGTWADKEIAWEYTHKEGYLNKRETGSIAYKINTNALRLIAMEMDLALLHQSPRIHNNAEEDNDD